MTWDPQGKHALLTGGTSGIGMETAVALLRAGMFVTMTVRDAKKGEEAKAKILARAGVPPERVDLLACDLASLLSVRAACATFAGTYNTLDVLINNAGVMELKEAKTSADGYELNIAVDYLAPFLLTELLLPLLRAAPEARIINVSSKLHSAGVIDLASLGTPHSFAPYTSYGSAKLAMILWTRTLARELTGTGVSVYALHPGVVATELTLKEVRRYPGILQPLLGLYLGLISPEKGARTSVFLATAPMLPFPSGSYVVGTQEDSGSVSSQNIGQGESLVSWTRTALNLLRPS